MSKLGQRMIAAAEEALAFAQGQETGARVHTVPDVKAIRQGLGLTQPAFAARFGLPVGNVRDWEQKRTTPDGAARVLLRVIERAPEVVAEVAQASSRPTLMSVFPPKEREAHDAIMAKGRGVGALPRG